MGFGARLTDAWRVEGFAPFGRADSALLRRAWQRGLAPPVSAASPNGAARVNNAGKSAIGMGLFFFLFFFWGGAKKAQGQETAERIVCRGAGQTVCFGGRNLIILS